jgi:hypothetical protein
VRVVRWLLLLPVRLIRAIWNVAVHGELWPDRGESYEQRVAAREARKRVERHGTP